MKKILVWLLVLVVEALAVVMPGQAVAGTFAPATSTTAIINRIIQGTPGLVTQVVGGSATVSASAQAMVTGASGLAIPVGVQAAGGLTAARVGALAGSAIRFGTFVGVASLVIPWILDQSGYKVCPPPDFFCKPGPDVNATPTAGGFTVALPGAPSVPVKASSGQDACDKYYAALDADNKAYYGTPVYTLYPAGTMPPGRCIGSKNGQMINGITWTAPTCTSPMVLSSDGRTCVAKGADVAVSEPELQTSITSAVGTSTPRMQDLVAEIQRANITMFQNSDPVTITAPPVTTPNSVTMDRINNPDGTTSTRNITQSTTVTPTQVGTTFGDAKIDYPATTTVTTTITNDVTHTVTTETKTIIEHLVETPQPLPPPITPPIPLPDKPTSPTPTEPLKIPTDYNREVTQQSILEQLKGTGMPTGSTATSAQPETDMKNEQDKVMPFLDGFAAKVGLVNWFPTIPTATCKNPAVPRPIVGGTIDVPICDAVGVFSKFISGVICFFALIGSVREVQAAMKA